MEIYLLKSSLSLIVLYGLYRIMLRYEFNHQLNRIVGLICILFSISFPFAQFNDIPQVSQLPVTFYVIAKGATNFRETVSSIVIVSNNALGIVLLVYSIGASVFLLRSVVGLATLLKLYFNSPKCYRWGFTVVQLSKNISPFTFFNVLFMGNSDIEDSEVKIMLLHEHVHRNQYHSIDTVLLDILTVIHWFNPVMWLFQRDIKAEHEYFADQRVLKSGVPPIMYQLVLFKAQTGTSIELGNYLSNKTSLNKRFNMMAKAKSKSKGSYLRASIFLMLMVVILFLGAFSSRNGTSQIDKVPIYEQGEKAMYQTIIRRIRYPASARTENHSGLVRVSFTVNEHGSVEHVKAETDKGGHLLNEIVVVGYSQSSQEAKGIDAALEAEAVSAVEALGKFIPAQKEGKPVRCVLVLPVKFKLGSKMK
jgi:hypothetical protein